MISIAAAVHVVIYLIIAGVIFGLLLWLIDFAKVQEPFRNVARVILAILAVMVVIGILLSLTGGPQVFRP